MKAQLHNKSNKSSWFQRFQVLDLRVINIKKIVTNDNRLLSYLIIYIVIHIEQFIFRLEVNRDESLKTLKLNKNQSTTACYLCTKYIGQVFVLNGFAIFITFYKSIFIKSERGKIISKNLTSTYVLFNETLQLIALFISMFLAFFLSLLDLLVIWLFGNLKNPENIFNN